MINAFSKKSSLLENILIVVGMSFYWPIFRNHYLGVLFSAHATGSYSETYTLLAFLIFLSILAILIALRSQRLSAFLDTRKMLIPGVSLAASLMAIILTFIRFSEPTQSIVSFMSALLLAVYVALITIAWGIVIARNRGKHIVFFLALSFLASFLISLCTQLPYPFNSLLPVVSPLVCGICWFFLSGKTERWQPFTREILSTTTLYTVLILILFLLMGSIARGLFSSGVMNYFPSTDGSNRPILSIILSLVLCFTVYATAHKERLINVIWVAFVLLFFGGLFITAALIPGLSSIDSDIVVISRTFLGFFLWVVITNVARSHKTDPLFLLCIFFLITDCASGLLTNYIVPYLSVQNPDFIAENMGVLALLMAFILLLGSFGFLSTAAFRFTSVPTASNAQGGLSNEAREHACKQISESCNLTIRETEVLYYVSQGHSIKKIAERLFISTSTVQSHVKSLYRKTGRHSRQEIIDLVNDREGC